MVASIWHWGLASQVLREQRGRQLTASAAMGQALQRDGDPYLGARIMDLVTDSDERLDALETEVPLVGSQAESVEEVGHA
jgi:hypothetical protein